MLLRKSLNNLKVLAKYLKLQPLEDNLKKKLSLALKVLHEFHMPCLCPRVLFWLYFLHSFAKIPIQSYLKKMKTGILSPPDKVYLKWIVRSIWLYHPLNKWSILFILWTLSNIKFWWFIIPFSLQKTYLHKTFLYTNIFPEHDLWILHYSREYYLHYHLKWILFSNSINVICRTTYNGFHKPLGFMKILLPYPVRNPQEVIYTLSAPQEMWKNK